MLEPALAQLPEPSAKDTAVEDAVSAGPPRSAADAAEPPDAAAEAEEGAAAPAAADEAPADPLLAAPPATEHPPAPDSLFSPLEAKIELERLVADERYEEAVPVGERLVELTDQEFGAVSREAAEARMALARVQSQAGRHEAAETTYLAAIDIVREVDGMFSPLAIEPLTGLGDNYQEAGQYLNAVSAYTEARTVSRRVYGLLNEGQIPIMDRLTATLQSLEQPLEADRMQLEALRIVERTHEPHSPEALAAIYKYARWLRDNGRYQEERDQYNRAIRIIRDHYGDDSVRLARPLSAIGNSFRHQRLPEGQGAESLQEALELLRASQPVDRLALAEVLRDIGDWSVAFSKVPYDGAEYKRAWQLLGEVEGGEEIRRRWFTGPEYVLREPISQRGLSNDPDALPGHVLVRFDLDETGETENVAVVESEPPGFKDEAVLRAVRRSRFRPQMVDGQIVPGRGLALRFTYRYKLDEEGDDE
ncbi:MAG TPA: TonB family protein [Gammaproteobacteria bacterium]